MKGFIKLWLHNASRLILVILAIVIFIGVIDWLDSYGTTLSYIGIGIWSLFCIVSLLTLIEYKKE